MERRKFLQNGLLAGVSTVAAGGIAAAGSMAKACALPAAKGEPFHMNYAPHDGMFRNSAGADILDQLRFMHDEGFRAFEDNGMLGRDKAMQEKIGNLLAKLGMQMGVFVIDGGDNWKISLTTGKQEFTDKFLDTCRRSVDVAKRCNATWMTVVPGFYERHLPIGLQTGHVIDALRRAAEIFEPHGLVMVLESLSDTPELFLRGSDQGYMLCRAVNSPACKTLYDIYHMQRNEGDIIRHIDWCWDEIGYIQIGDNPGRKEPTTGETDYKNIFRHLYAKGYKGVLGMEHGNSKPGREGERAVIDAYRKVDDFL